MSDVTELAKKTNKTKSQVYYLARKLGRLPTEEEMLEVKMGRPRGRPVYYLSDKDEDIRELAKRTGRNRMTIYKQCWELGRMPTEEEVLSVKRGRKLKYKKGD